jgi:nitrite reductase (NADH) large subunit
MERQIDCVASDLLRRTLAGSGIAVRAPAEPAAFVGTDRLEGVMLGTGETIPAVLAVMAVGVRPRTALARAANLACGAGILVDDRLATSDPGIFALGECIEHRGRTFGLVAPIWEQSAVLADRLAGRDAAYAGSLAFTSLKVTGVDLFSAGTYEPSAGDEPLTLLDRAAGIYRKLVLREGRLVGALLFGDVEDAPWYLDLIRSRASIERKRGSLMFGPAYTRDLAA